MNFRHILLFLSSCVAVGVAVQACDAQVDPGYSGEILATLRGSVLNVTEASSTSGPLSAGIMWYTSTPQAECAGPNAGCGFGYGGVVGDSVSVCADDCADAFSECSASKLETLTSCLMSCDPELNFFVSELEFGLCSSGTVGQSVVVTGEFPASFTLDLFQPPNEEALLADATGVQVALGTIVAFEGPANEGPEDFSETAVVGTSTMHVVVYAPVAVPESSPWGMMFGAGLEPGFHLLEIMPAQLCEDVVLVPGEFGSCGGPDRLGVATEGFETAIELELTGTDDVVWPNL